MFDTAAEFQQGEFGDDLIDREAAPCDEHVNINRSVFDVLQQASWRGGRLDFGCGITRVHAQFFEHILRRFNKFRALFDQVMTALVKGRMN